MLKRYSLFFAYLLLVLLPMQALATANMLICNSMMQANIVEKSVELMSSNMPCHQTMQNDTSADSHKKSHQQVSHKSSCATVCANMCALTAMPVNIQSTFALNFTQMIDFNHQSYASITLPNLQRPPIAFI
ncbi:MULTISPECIES: CopL family metal-binding regulatory protein [Methylotenera]|uniref:CopL family metal-binding regulatory protein n=1 Tax=Methylotenera TaxID=359407 RepID=UPI00035CFE10|nr:MULTISPECIES: CopL family metal-binding regulatory protein [Methylotenera]